ncbi:MAG: AbrB/MazE/SpoVT family DNA-binding domain-containing protein [Candidatus Methanoperedens sp.]|nr:AbrB/MazE/SpoVT family DNA-binding domain-containing protein [Candidatus Methanoperedens sp.]MCZ7396248.1 AbrB/MazE/SpoVT family DNA-binding domain-containing protein [Candidatus Methanoperedens sp.]
MEDIETITMSAKGQVIIPARIRKKFRLKKGDKLLLEVDNRNIKMTPKTVDLTTLVGSVKDLDMELVRKQIEEMRKDDEERERLIEKAIKVKKR